MKLYLVTDGEYSDYHIDGVYSTKEKAEEARRLYAATNDIEEYELDALPDHPPGMMRYSVYMNKHGNVSRTRVVSVAGVQSGDVDWQPCGAGGDVLFSVWAADETGAVKVANEKRVQLIANNEWTTNFGEWRNRYYPDKKP